MNGRIALTAVAAFLAFGPAPPAHAQAGELEVVSPDSLALSSEDGKSKPASVWIRNAGARDVTPTFAAHLEDGEGKPRDAQVVVVGADGKDAAAGPVAANRVARYRLYVKGAGAASDSTGELEASAPGIGPASLGLSLAPKSAVDRGVGGALGYPAIAALLLTLIAAFTVRNLNVARPLGTLDLDFTASFASTLTAAGALFGTVIAAGVLPEETKAFSKEGYTALHLLFGALILLAGLVYTALQTPTWADKDGDATKKVRKMEGYGWSFLLACFVTLWAVFGELGVLWLLIQELGPAQGFSDSAATFFQVVLAITALALIPYTIRRVQAVFEAEKPAAGGAAGAVALPAGTTAPRVSLL